MIRLVSKIIKHIPNKVCYQKACLSSFSLYKFSTSDSNNKKQKQVYYEDIISDHNYNKKIMELEKMNESERIYFLDTIVKKFNPDPIEICDYANIIIDGLVANQDYTNALKCCNMITQFLKSKVSKQDLYLFSFYSIMIDCYLKQQEIDKAQECINEAEEIYNLNKELLEKDIQNHFSHTHMLSLRFSDIGQIEKCVYYSSICLSIQGISIQHLVFPTLLIIDSLETLNKSNEALQFGTNFLSNVTFQEVGVSYDETQLEILKQILERVASIYIKLDNLSDAYLYQDMLLYLILITESESSYKYEAVYNWRQEILFQLALQHKGNLRELFLKCELEKQKKIGNLNKELEQQAEERATKLQNLIQEQYGNLSQVLQVHKEVYEISEKRFINDSFLPEVDQQNLLNLVKKSVELEEKVLNVPIIDQYFVKECYYKIKAKLAKEIQEKIEKQLSKKK
ncbi:hypothetical protein ABPG74_016644 [Tetrahymena malaccensis]